MCLLNDEAYAWAKNKKCEVNPRTGAIQIYDMIVVPQVVAAAEDFMLFAEVSDQDLIDLGLPVDMLPFVRAIPDQLLILCS